jgi:hypothetical protein
VVQYFVQSKDAIAEYSSENTFLDRIQNMLLSFFIICLTLSLALFLLTLPVVWKLQIKIREIYGLL